MLSKPELIREALSDLSDSDCLALFKDIQNLHSMEIGNRIIKQVEPYLSDLPKDTKEDDEYERHFVHMEARK